MKEDAGMMDVHYSEVRFQASIASYIDLTS